MNRAKIKGTTAESAVVSCLLAAGYLHVERRALQGNLDKGDIAGIPGLVIEVKNVQGLSIPGALKEAEVEKINAKARIGVLWHKIRGKADPLDWPVTMTGRQFLEILEELGYKPDQQQSFRGPR